MENENNYWVEVLDLVYDFDTETSKRKWVNFDRPRSEKDAKFVAEMIKLHLSATYPKVRIKRKG